MPEMTPAEAFTETHTEKARNPGLGLRKQGVLGNVTASHVSSGLFNNDVAPFRDRVLWPLAHVALPCHGSPRGCGKSGPEEPRGPGGTLGAVLRAPRPFVHGELPSWHVSPPGQERLGHLSD